MSSKQLEIIYNNDTPSAFEFVPYEPSAEDLGRQVDLFAENGIDTYSQDVFEGSTLYDSRFCEHLGKRQGGGYWARVKMADALAAGLEPVAIWADRCHRHNMRFVAALRVNDRHSRGPGDRPWETGGVLGGWRGARAPR